MFEFQKTINEDDAFASKICSSLNYCKHVSPPVSSPSLSILLLLFQHVVAGLGVEQHLSGQFFDLSEGKITEFNAKFAEKKVY